MFLFSKFWRLGIQDQGASMVGSWRGPTSGLQTVSLHPQEADNKRKQVLSWLLRAQILSCGLPAHVNPDHLPKTPPPSTITLGDRVSTYEFGGEWCTYSVLNILTYFSYLYHNGPVAQAQDLTLGSSLLLTSSNLQIYPESILILLFPFLPL